MKKTLTHKRLKEVGQEKIKEMNIQELKTPQEITMTNAPITRQHYYRKPGATIDILTVYRLFNSLV